MSDGYQPPPGVGLLFASRAEIEAVPPAEREAYYRIVSDLLAHPKEYGFRRETGADLAEDYAVDRALAGLNDDWGAP
ncbi:hypothetical protein [Bradyrhizobium cenepequi]